MMSAAATQPAYCYPVPSANGFCATSATPMLQAQHNAVGPVLDDLAARFIVNCPGSDADASSEELMLLMFEVEKAHWFYTDFWRERNQALPALGIREFTSQLFNHCAMLNSFASQADTIVSEWQAYKRGVPTFGACLLNQSLNKVLLVRGWNAKSWGWPKGKVNKDEDDAICAAREVEEEIGYDILPYIDEANTMQAKVGEQKMKLYVIPYVPESTVFETKTRQEISEIRWHNISDLMGEKKQDGKSSTKFYTVAPVLSKLKSWIADHKRSLSRSKTPVRREKEQPVRLSKSAECTPVRSRDVKAQNDSPPRDRNAKSSPNSPKLSKKDKKNKTRLVETEVDAAGVARDNNVTFGDTYQQIHKGGFSAEEMFKANEEKFGIVSTYSFDQYTTALPGKKAADQKPKGMLYADRFRPCNVPDVQTSVVVAEASTCAAEATKQSGSGFAFKFDKSSIMDSLTF